MNPDNTDLTVRNIDVFKTGADLFVRDFVPAQAQPISVLPHGTITLTPSARNVAAPRPLMIIPKKALETPVKPPMKVAVIEA